MEYYAQKLYTKEGQSKVNPFPEKRVLHIGSGNKRLPGSVTVDMLKLPEVDVVHNLDEYPWPFSDVSFDIIFGHNVLEHLTDIVKAMEEIHRLLKSGGRVILTVPYFRSTDAVADVTHKHFFTAQSLDYFIEQRSTLSDYRYTARHFKKIGFWYGWPQESDNPLVRMFKRWIHAHPKFYDQYLSILFPVKILVWELERLD